MNIEPMLVSIVMPVFNMSAYLDDAIRSLLNQTLVEFELIIINDGSTDHSQVIIERWAQKDRRIKFYQQDNKGRSYTRNKGISLAKSEYIAMMDPDDISTPERLKESYQILQSNQDVVAVSGQVEAICMYGVSLLMTMNPLEHKDIEQRLLYDDGQVFHQSASMFRKSIVERVGGYDLSYEMGEDTDLFLKLALHGQLVNSDKTFLYYRQHPAAITSQCDMTMLNSAKYRLAKAWEARGLQFDKNFHHWLENRPIKKAYEDLLKWGWNALNKGKKEVAQQYAKKLIISEPLKFEVWRFYYCVYFKEILNE